MSGSEIDQMLKYNSGKQVHYILFVVTAVSGHRPLSFQVENAGLNRFRRFLINKFPDGCSIVSYILKSTHY